MTKYDEIRALFAEHDQDHVFSGWNALAPHQRNALLESCANIDFSWLEARRKELTAPNRDANDGMAPAPVVGLPVTDAERMRFAEARAAGEELLRKGKAAAFLVAGGQGSRLGFSGPKGSFPLGPLSGRTLFQWHAEQIAARSKRYDAAIPWYIMTSRENDRDTRDFFEANGYFGLPRDAVFFFKQEMVPCLDFAGKLLLSSPSSIAVNPNGHGGSLSGLSGSGALADMRRRGVEVISYFQVDNPLVTICDPTFLGWHAISGSEMSSKVVEKCAPSERIGVVCVKNGKPAVVEYIDMDKESQEARSPGGKLKFWAGSIAVHMIDVAFAEKIAAGAGLPWHQSRKKVAFFDGNGIVRPDKENAMKFETFVFDALPLAAKTLNFEVRREHEFAPVKNADGEDSAATSRQLLSNFFLEWLADCGVAPAEAGGRPTVEISPLYSLDAEELAQKIKPYGLRLERGLLLE